MLRDICVKSPSGLGKKEVLELCDELILLIEEDVSEAEENGSPNLEKLNLRLGKAQQIRTMVKSLKQVKFSASLFAWLLYLLRLLGDD